jgi:hypothetical protein
MNSIVIPAVANPRRTHVRSADRLNDVRQGRTATTSTVLAHIRRSQATPAAPSWSTSPSDAARPSCTQHIAASAIDAPARVAPGSRDEDMRRLNRHQSSMST